MPLLAPRSTSGQRPAGACQVVNLQQSIGCLVRRHLRVPAAGQCGGEPFCACVSASGWSKPRCRNVPGPRPPTSRADAQDGAQPLLDRSAPTCSHQSSPASGRAGDRHRAGSRQTLDYRQTRRRRSLQPALPDGGEIAPHPGAGADDEEVARSWPSEDRRRAADQSTGTRSLGRVLQWSASA